MSKPAAHITKIDSNYCVYRLTGNGKIGALIICALEKKICVDHTMSYEVQSVSQYTVFGSEYIECD